MTDAMLRQGLSAFLGEVRYSEFVRKGFRRGRLLYWQEQEWARFTAAHPEMAVDLASLETALRVCHLHGDELQTDLVDVLDACRNLGRPFLLVHAGITRPSQVVGWIAEKGIRTLNVAGSRESGAPGIGDRAERFLADVFRKLGHKAIP